MKTSEILSYAILSLPVGYRNGFYYEGIFGSDPKFTDNRDKAVLFGMEKNARQKVKHLKKHHKDGRFVRKKV